MELIVRTTTLALRLSVLIDDTTATIGTPTGINGSVTVKPVLTGDANANSTIDIVDALIVAHYYVGLNPPSLNPALADTNNDGKIDIIDALHIAQFYVGLIPGF